MPWLLCAGDVPQRALPFDSGSGVRMPVMVKCICGVALALAALQLGHDDDDDDDSNLIRLCACIAICLSCLLAFRAGSKSKTMLGHRGNGTCLRIPYRERLIEC